jgi:hypothetical protein
MGRKKVRQREKDQSSSDEDGPQMLPPNLLNLNATVHSNYDYSNIYYIY